MQDKTLLQWLKKYKVEIPLREIKRALSDLRSAYPGIEYLPEYERAEKLWEFLKPTTKFDPDEEDEPEALFLSPQVKGYIRHSDLEDLIGTGWGNCFTLSILYTILAREMNIDCGVYPLRKKYHAVCYANIDGKKVLVDTAAQVFDNRPAMQFETNNRRYEYNTNSYFLEDEFVAIMARAYSLSHGKRDSKEALFLLTEFTKRYPFDEGGWCNKGFAFAGLRKYGRAIECYDRAIELFYFCEEAWIDKGNALEHLGRYKEAMNCYNKALEINPRFGWAWYNKGLLLYLKEKYEEALECFNSSIAIRKKSAGWAWLWKGQVLMKLRRNKKAFKCYEKAIELAIKKNDPELEARANKELKKQLSPSLLQRVSGKIRLLR